MNIIESDILKQLYNKIGCTQRELASLTRLSLGLVNKTINQLISEELATPKLSLTKKAQNLMKENKPQRAIILAAGFGMRMVPINMEMPKGLLEVKGEVLIERIIKQLHEKDIHEIYVIVGFMKERYEYLMDEYDVQLIVNTEYATKNNLHSISLVTKYLDHSYIIPCDIWCESNPFDEHELYSWYMVTESLNEDSEVKINRKKELVRLKENIQGNQMIGICYVTGEDSEKIKENVKKFSSNPKYDDSFWEEALYEKNKMIPYAKVLSSKNVVEINTYEQLRDLDGDSSHLKNDAIEILCKSLDVDESDITDITVLKKGMTNRSFMFSCDKKKYIMRIPGAGTDQLINRREEADVYKVIHDKNICDDIVYINPNNGYKITEFLEGARVCNPESDTDLKACMKRLKGFHEMKLKVDHEFNIFYLIEFYESLLNGVPSIYKHYQQTKENVLSLKNYIDEHIEEKVLTHIDAVPDNFLIVEKNGKQDIRLIDWEYAGMQDPHVDIAMFCIYSLYEKEQVDHLIDLYFEGKCDKETRIKIYCYISACGLLWSNWCEYKRNLGVEFGEYSLRQYRYAKDYYRIVIEEIGGNK